MKLSASNNKKLSLAVGVLTFIAAAFLLLGDQWGFSPLAKQIFTSITGITALINLYFLGSTAQKITEGKK